MALGKPATQSSTYANDPLFSANRVVDGNSNTYGLSCANNGDGPGGPNWLMVDLNSIFFMKYVIATSRGDCCSEYCIHLSLLIINELSLKTFKEHLKTVLFGDAVGSNTLHALL